MVRLALPYVSFNLVPVFKSSLNALLLGAYNIPWLVVRLIVMTILWKFIHGQLSQLFNDGILCILAFILLLIPYTHFLYLPRQSLYCLVMLFVTAIDFTFLMALQAIDALIIYNIRLCVLALSFHIPPENHPTPMVPLPRQSTCMYRMPRLFADWLLLWSRQIAKNHGVILRLYSAKHV